MNKKLVWWVLFAGLTLSSATFAATNILDAITGGSESSAVKNLIAGYGENWKDKYLFTKTPFADEFEKLGKLDSSDKTIAANSTVFAQTSSTLGQDNQASKNTKELFIIPPMIDKKMETADNFSKLEPVNQGIFFTLNANISSTEVFVNYLIAQSCTDKQKKVNDLTVFVTNTNTPLCVLKADDAANYSMDSLLGPLNYQTDQSDAAQNYIKYASLLTLPFTLPEQADLEKAGKAGKKYLIFLRTYLAGQTAGLSNLYQMYLERKPVSGLGAKAGLGNDKKDASPLEIEQFAASRRLNPNITTAVDAIDGKGKKVTEKKNWRQSMEHASPATVQREMVYLLAEMRYQMFQEKLANERLSAALSLMQIEQNRQALFIENITLRAEYEQAKMAVDQTSTTKK